MAGVVMVQICKHSVVNPTKLVEVYKQLRFYRQQCVLLQVQAIKQYTVCRVAEVLMFNHAIT